MGWDGAERVGVWGAGWGEGVEMGWRWDGVLGWDGVGRGG